MNQKTYSYYPTEDLSGTLGLWQAHWRAHKNLPEPVLTKFANHVATYCPSAHYYGPAGNAKEASFVAFVSQNTVAGRESELKRQTVNLAQLLHDYNLTQDFLKESK